MLAEISPCTLGRRSALLLLRWAEWDDASRGTSGMIPLFLGWLRFLSGLTGTRDEASKHRRSCISHERRSKTFSLGFLAMPHVYGWADQRPIRE